MLAKTSCFQAITAICGTCSACSSYEPCLTGKPNEYITSTSSKGLGRNRDEHGLLRCYIRGKLLTGDYMNGSVLYTRSASYRIQAVQELNSKCIVILIKMELSKFLGLLQVGSGEAGLGTSIWFYERNITRMSVLAEGGTLLCN